MVDSMLDLMEHIGRMAGSVERIDRRLLDSVGRTDCLVLVDRLEYYRRCCGID